MRTFKIYSLRKLQIYNTVLLAINTILYIRSPPDIFFHLFFFPIILSPSISFRVPGRGRNVREHKEDIELCATDMSLCSQALPFRFYSFSLISCDILVFHYLLSQNKSGFWYESHSWLHQAYMKCQSLYKRVLDTESMEVNISGLLLQEIQVTT